jgi:hypothetical protein
MSNSLSDDRFKNAFFPSKSLLFADGFIDANELEHLIKSNGIEDLPREAQGAWSFKADGNAYHVGMVVGDGADRYETAWRQCGTFDKLVYLADGQGEILIASCDHYWEHTHADGTPSDDCEGREGTYLLQKDIFAERLFPLIGFFLVEKIRSLGPRPWLNR